MNRKTAMDSSARKMELINRKVREINERRRGMKLTSLEDELDRQELHRYMRLLGVEPGNVRLESMDNEATSRNKIFYATIFFEVLVEISVLYYIASLMLMPGASTTEWIMSGLLGVVFFWLAYRIVRDVRRK